MAFRRSGFVPLSPPDYLPSIDKRFIGGWFILAKSWYLSRSHVAAGRLLLFAVGYLLIG